MLESAGYSQSEAITNNVEDTQKIRLKRFRRHQKRYKLSKQMQDSKPSQVKKKEPERYLSASQ